MWVTPTWKNIAETKLIRTPPRQPSGSMEETYLLQSGQEIVADGDLVELGARCRALLGTVGIGVRSTVAVHYRMCSLGHGRGQQGGLEGDEDEEISTTWKGKGSRELGAPWASPALGHMICTTARECRQPHGGEQAARQRPGESMTTRRGQTVREHCRESDNGDSLSFGLLPVVCHFRLLPKARRGLIIKHGLDSRHAESSASDTRQCGCCTCDYSRDLRSGTLRVALRRKQQ